MWYPKEDFYSLFQHQAYAPIDGLRSISCIMITTIHVITILNSFVPPYPHRDWMAYLTSYSFKFSALLSLSLEIFFMISGFLLTTKCTQKDYQFSWKNYPCDIIRRACRFWPGILLITIVMLILGEPNSDWAGLWLFYQNYVSVEYWTVGFAALWSVSLDMQVHILLPILLYMITNVKQGRQRMRFILSILVILSVFYNMYAFDPKTMDLMTLVYRQNSMRLLMPPGIFDWIKSEYNVTFAFPRPNGPPLFKAYLDSMYLTVASRYSSFLIGSILALNVQFAQNNHTTIRYGAIRKYLYLILVILFIFISISSSEPIPVNDIVLRIAISVTRQLFTLSQAFILFSALCPSTHPYHSSWIRSFLTLRIWAPIAKLSYLIYVIHFRIIFELVLRNVKFFDPNSFPIDWLTLICLKIAFSICVVISLVWYILVDKPFLRLTQRLLSNDKKHV